MKPQAAIQANAELVRRTAEELLGTVVGYDREGVRWLDAYLDRQHTSGERSLQPGLAQTLGSFFGECIRLTLGGAWVETRGAWGVRISEQITVFPFAKVAKQLESGRNESVLAMFETIAALAGR